MGNDVTVPSSRQPIPPARGNEAIDFIHREERHAFHEQRDVGCLRCAATFLRQIDLSAAVLRTRLGRSLAAKQLDGIIAFSLQLETKLVLKAIWLVDTQQWTEVVNALKFAAQRGYCQLPITLDVADCDRHDSKQAYLADARVIALWKVVGRHVNFGGNHGRFELFDQPGGGVRALRDEPGYELDINPALLPRPPIPPTHHQRQPARQIHNRPAGGQLDSGWHAHGGVLDGLLNHSPHQPPHGCTAIAASRWDEDPPVEIRTLLLTPFDMPFVAWVALYIFPDTDMVDVSVITIEPPVGGASDAFKDRRPTTPLSGARPAGQHHRRHGQDGADDGGDDDDDDDGDSDEDMDSNGDGDGDGEQEQQQEDEEDEGVEEREAKRRRTAR
ncbi:unnamed protein product [Vitrella brassicaformis CCMP3155]|uniref:Uncharacterized protein n=1 Tax=Vitrella brassicaformis (strain CCMP3155) TaxID=1169540 RepID=A0A0G4G627_VITBC|nr:unnamed protein product [Vitrella brassicaformis CCMP3155]|eukprot:CEM23996.1 unnamed protein product [Vitrella brassicaformis CCMP3155]